MSLVEALRVSVTALATHKLRSLLTVLGIVIGISSVVSLMSIGQGSQERVLSRITAMGTNLLYVRPGASSEGRVRGAQGGAASLTLEDATALADPVNVPSVAAVAPQVQTFAQVVAAGQNVNTQIIGVTPDYQYVRNSPVADGDFISDRDVEARSMVVVLGATVADNLFQGGSPLGESVKINNRQFRVVGVLKRMGGTGFGLQDDVVLAPITTVQSRIMAQRTAQGGRTVSSINVQLAKGAKTEQATGEIAAILRQRHRLTGSDDFTITSQEETIAAQKEVTGTFTTFLGIIAGISLLVAGIGIMNIMLVSVAERTREIGIRKAVGAKRRDILMQFLMEATVLSLFGGGVGLLGGWGVSRFISGRTFSGQVLYTVVPPHILILAVAVAVATGLFFGIYPAARAARLNPIAALRYE
ncbi:MAG: ABC transporter permease [Chloroflexi bacterium]|nr:ABC transporter permease [Chloroflexota bacterium]